MSLIALRVSRITSANIVKFKAQGVGKGIIFGTAVLFSLLVVGCGGGGTDPSVTPPSQIGNEGSPQAPVLLVLGTAYPGQVGAGGTSYYGFDINQAGNYEIRLTDTQSNLGWELEVSLNLGMPGTVASCDTSQAVADEICLATLSLNGFPDIRYLIKVIEHGMNAGRFNISVTFVPPTHYLDCASFQTLVNPIFDRNLTGTTCSASGCHAVFGGSGGAFKLYPNAAPNSPEMQANFLAARGFSNLTDPAQSQLLLEPLAGAQPIVGSHAGGDIFVDTSDQNYQALLSWILNQISVPNNCYP